MTSALSAALKKPALDQGASSALADSLKAPQKAATTGGFDLSTIPLPPAAFPGLYQDSSSGEDYVADLDNLALGTSIGTQFAGSYKSCSGTPIVSTFSCRNSDDCKLSSYGMRPYSCTVRLGLLCVAA